MNTLVKTETHLQALDEAILLANDIVDRNYLMRLPEQEIQPFDSMEDIFTVQKNIRIMKILTLVYEQEEDITDKLTTLFNGISHMNGSLSLLINSDGQQVDLYMAVRTNQAQQEVYPLHDLFQKSFESQFQGSVLKVVSNTKTHELFDAILHRNSDLPSIVSVCGIPSKKSLQQAQGIDRLIESMQGERFSAVIIGTALSSSEIALLRQNYASLYTELSPLRQSTRTYGTAESQAVTEGMTKGVTESATSTISHSTSQSTSASITTTEGVTHTGSVSANLGFRIKDNVHVGVGGGYSKSSSSSESKGMSESKTSGMSSSTGKSTGQSMSRSVSIAATASSSETMQLTFENKTVSEMLKKLDAQLERVSDAEDYGMWEFSAYFIAENPKVAQIAGQTYRSVIRGENSSIEQGALLQWNEEQIPEMTRYLSSLCHPMFHFEATNQQQLLVKPTSLIHGEEITLALHLPQKSLNTVPVLRMAEFGRSVQYIFGDGTGRKIELGKLQHFGKVESQEVHLNVDQLVSHTFISGSTGSGKSNTMYQIMNGLRQHHIKTLVIEPAKGEYRHVYGHLPDVRVFGTNQTQGQLLQINPFIFPAGIHIQEHIDRLVEIMSACWPLYAAMPNILKQSVSETYERIGWILSTSTFIGSTPSYPTFRDLLHTLPSVIASYGFSKEVEDNYKGSLVARVESMTNGIVGPLFNHTPIQDEDLFDHNAIIDLSRIGSLETKSLIMGIVFLKLHEYRMVQADEMNTPLRHVTILEEAHHLLKNVSNTGESTIQQKSVEMMTNAIAEMRSYGQGFIIVDQSPSAVDPAAIKNTNTKIIMRLPDVEDRQRLGKSIGLNEEQIHEISKLRPGSAIVHQSTWLNPVVVKVNHHVSDGRQILINQVEESSPHDVLCHLIIDQPKKIPSMEAYRLLEYIQQISLEEEDRAYLRKMVEQLYEGRTPNLFSRFFVGIRARIVFHLIDGALIMKYCAFSKNSNDYQKRFNQALKHFAGNHIENVEELKRLILHHWKGMRR
ncbi:ATP-binding protein [Exiguobacterium sp. SH0S2]|uniref:ATP-binding protein n=1 Tax=Exiguobacterium sp. SH0S2 TaxID=2510950 RepID=UPI00137584DC|nr:ATP-binding protein [Exiguobacterium sp. SH0S2]